jgi:hypothetical protein
MSKVTRDSDGFIKVYPRWLWCWKLILEPTIKFAIKRPKTKSLPVSISLLLIGLPADYRLWK